MWDYIMNNLPDGITIFCSILAFVIPYVIYKVNQMLHAAADPPWRKEDMDSRNE